MSMVSIFALLLVAGVAAMGVAALVLLVMLVLRGRTETGTGVES